MNVRWMGRLRRCVWMGTIFPWMAAAATAQHTDFEVGQDGSPEAVLVVGGDEKILSGEEAIELEPVDVGPLAGYYAVQEPGWESVEADEPDEGLFVLLPDHLVSLRRDSFDPGFGMFDEFFGSILVSDGDTYTFESDSKGALHQDLFFAADPGTPLGTELFATFALTDLAGVHSDSDAFTLRFVTVPEPASFVGLGLGALWIVGRVRRRE